MKEQEPNKPTDHNREPFRARISQELGSELLGLIGDMEDDLSQADEAVHEGHPGEILKYLGSVLLEINEAIYLVRREVREQTSKEIEEHSIEINGIRYYMPYKEPSDPTSPSGS